MALTWEAELNNGEKRIEFPLLKAERPNLHFIFLNDNGIPKYGVDFTNGKLYYEGAWHDSGITAPFDLIDKISWYNSITALNGIPISGRVGIHFLGVSGTNGKKAIRVFNDSYEIVTQV